MSPLEVGGKAHNLFLLAEAGIPVPPFKVVTASIFRRWNEELFSAIPHSLEGEAFKVFDQQLRDHFSSLEHGQELAAIILNELPEANYYAVRSSGTEEDGESSSFAGVFESYLFVKREDLLLRVLDCWRSRFSHRALSYIRTQGARQDFPLAVIIQAMVPAEKAGVMVTANVDLQEPFQTVVSAVLGAGEGLVSGECEADSFVVSQEGRGVLRREIVRKETMLVQDTPGGLRAQMVPKARSEDPVLNDSELEELGGMALRIEAIYGGRPQDIEWCFHEGNLHILQTRPLTSWAELDKSRPIELWDSSNIGESYHGAVSPLTFSFTRNNYKYLFRNLLLDLGCKEDALEKSAVHLDSLLGHYEGHLYYRLTHWKELLHPVPGGALFMKLLGPFIGSSAELGRLQGKGMALDALDALKVVGRILLRYVFRGPMNRRFEGRYERFRKDEWAKLCAERSEADCLCSIESFYRKLGEFWLMPTYNDFFSVMWTGLFTTTVEFVYSERTPGERSEVMGRLLAAKKGLGPVVELKKLVSSLLEKKEVLELINRETPERLKELWQARDPAIAAIIPGLEEFLSRWGFRCEDELLLEARDLIEDPTLLFEQIKLGLQGPSMQTETRASVMKPRGLREYLLYPLLLFVAGRTRELLETRESMRIKRSELFAIMRRYVKGLGILWEGKRLDSADDIFHLQFEELLEPGLDLRERVRESRALVQGHAPERFYFDGKRIFVPGRPTGPVKGLVGTPCRGGTVSGEIVFYEKGMSAAQLAGKILITERSGPGHVTLFPLIKAMVVEKGSSLSHAVIAAREFGLPTVVGVPDLCLRLAGVSQVEVNADTGEVTVKE